jgi:hypothetical protein
MATYTPDQCAKLAALPAELILLTMMVDRHSVIAAYREVSAAMKFIREAKHNFPANALIQSVSSEAHTASSHDQHLDLSTPQSAVSAKHDLEARIQEALLLLANDAEGDEYKTFLLHVAEKVVEAAGAGFFGGGAKVSEAEKQFLGDLRLKLGVSP